MTGLNHAATGALVAVVIKQPELALPLALLAHFAIDAIPHWDYGLTGLARKIAMGSDLSLSIILLIILAIVLVIPGWLVITCGLLCMAPDVMWLPEILQGKPPKIYQSGLLGQLRRYHKTIQRVELPRGLYVEMVWFAIALAFILVIGR
ncbi:MAG: hypothetical protein ABSD10_02475 [Candidatus Saccharimonadales bacterium]|jgi:hypothetical protein